MAAVEDSFAIHEKLETFFTKALADPTMSPGLLARLIRHDFHITIAREYSVLDPATPEHP